MRSPAYLLTVLTLSVLACSSQAGTPRDPGSPTPVADPRPVPAGPRGEGSAPAATRSRGSEHVPQRPDQAPLVPLRDALEIDSLIGRRVRVAGRCVARGEGRRGGFWTLGQAGATVEVRGLVPMFCATEDGEDLTIFAQIEPKAAGSNERILLRLPD